MMRIRILYFNGCPNHPPAVKMAHRVVAEYSLNADVEEVEVTPNDVVQYRFLGSPTVQVDGVDIEPAARTRTDFAMSCRVYNTPAGLPTESMFLDALGINATRAPRSTTDSAGIMAIGGSVVTAILSSACCWIPLLFLAFGASSAGASAVFAKWRPVFIALAVIMLGLGFYFAYFRKPACADGCCAVVSRRSRRWQQGVLWMSTLLVAAFIFFPKYVGVLLDDSSRTVSVASIASENQASREYVFDVEGMTCEGCATVLRNELVKLDSVREVRVDYEEKTAWVTATNQAILNQGPVAAKGVGYTMLPRADAK